MKIVTAVAIVFGVTACASALHEPQPVARFAPGLAHGRSVDELMRDANAAWMQRADPHQAEAAQGLYLDAAAADEHRIDGLLGAMRVLAFRIEHEPGVSRDKLVEIGVSLGQWCQRRAPAEAECDYRLAIALGQQARERPSTGRDALGTIVELLQRASARAPRLDEAGPQRILALVLLRAPSWPVGPGDPEAALEAARAAVRLFPDRAENQLVFGEALAANHQPEPASAAYRKAFALATAARRAGDPEAATWVAQARAGMAGRN